jgi:NADPH:quinone reductase-like Zn-dependent oxidoreductase
MQAIRTVMPEPYTITVETYEIGDPEPNQVLVAAEASGVSPGTELAVYTGVHQWLKDPTRAWPKFPFVAGYSAVGRVLKAGSGVTRFKEGDRVIWPGRHESQARLPTSGRSRSTSRPRRPRSFRWRASRFRRWCSRSASSARRWRCSDWA